MPPLATNMRGEEFRRTACPRTYHGAAAPAAMPTSIATSSGRAPERLRLQPRNELDRILAADRLEIGGAKAKLLEVLHLIKPEIGIVRAVGDLRGRHEL